MKPIIRNGLYFYRKEDIITVYLGDKNEHDTEYICCFNIFYLDSFLAGLTALKAHTL